MDIDPIKPDDAASLEEWAALVNAVADADAPWEHPTTAEDGARQFTWGWDGEPAVPFLGMVDGRAVAWGSIATSDYDNFDMAYFRFDVHPDHRRQGHGSAMLAHLVDEARARNRTNLITDAWESPAADAFAVHHGFERKLASINRRQHLAEVDWSELDRRYDEALPHAAGYVLERWPVPTPAERLDDLARMASAINDAPLDDLDYEDEVFTGARMRAYEENRVGRHERLYRVVARHAPSGELAGQTVVAVEADHPTRGHQHDTSVVRAHRGRRLGLLLKTDMLRWLAEAEPVLETVDTWNAESNDHMIGVNEVLGYRVLGREWAYQRSLAAD
ncbi:GNAT family N-acetyltransferase [Nocardioides sp. J9]|uniref:GNAT family N-acetyltransferase n=1 Tax=Nocardioides sp. J9 TaxID=935844 RepID=UPI00164770C4|nr:GNAT family N-acetyltransferase [Nocardioides sp. J9]